MYAPHYRNVAWNVKYPQNNTDQKWGAVLFFRSLMDTSFQLMETAQPSTVLVVFIAAFS